MSPLAKLFEHARQYRRSAILASIYSALNKFFDVLPEVLIGVAVDVVVSKQDSFLAKLGVVDTQSQLIWLGVLTVLIWGGESLFQYLYSVEWRDLAQNLQHKLRQEAYAHVQKLELGWFENRSSGNLLAVMNDDINQMERFLNTGANAILQIVCSSILISIVFFALAPKLALISLLPVPLILWGTFWFQNRLAPRYAEVREAAGQINGRLNNNLYGIATIKSYAAEDFEAAHVEAASQNYVQTNAAAIRLSSAITPVIRMAILAGFVVTLVYGGWMALHGQIAVGSYSVLVYLTQRLLWPFTGLAEIADLCQRSMASIDRVLALLNTPIGIPYAGAALPRAQVAGEVVFDNIGFSYDGVHATLTDINLTLPAGKTVGFVGSTGSGKSTLIKLLLRFYLPQHGRVRVDGRDVAEFDLQDLRRSIGYVAQEPFLTDGSVADNIGYGMPHATRAQIEAAGKAAEAHDFITRLPQGYDTPVGERGQKLSGGQRQRIALARAILKDPAILVLDEATSAVDNETEAAIQRSLAQVARGRTTLVIAHRLSTVRHANVIHVLEHGRIVESGTHDALLVANGSYAALWRLQTGESVTL
ncbi:ATP-binding cassette, subfamily B [Andreprevotia lacus DSM 23236]|jgi:ATP-binding cassette subfamily B protein|uniref:ATP-binding cassette, subfamily B n=1 Tax=Andreprevotia lacus DSM 23236 TaxID=1121001 RepID=A0A1W1XVD6_9NEIS|nr:ABC transporter ATP-binding protein [Andreprevotia lacus]SMC27511.1 ATP-binding cassette, subfamily B [Andreprevotia lacus DSM 23236]